MSQEMITQPPVEAGTDSVVRHPWPAYAAGGLVMAATLGIGAGVILHNRSETPACQVAYKLDGSEGDRYVTTPDGEPVRIHVYEQPYMSARVGVAPAAQLDSWGPRDYRDLPDVRLRRLGVNAVQKISFVLGGKWDLVAEVHHDELITKCEIHPAH